MKYSEKRYNMSITTKKNAVFLSALLLLLNNNSITFAKEYSTIDDYKLKIICKKFIFDYEKKS